MMKNTLRYAFIALLVIFSSSFLQAQSEDIVIIRMSESSLKNKSFLVISKPDNKVEQITLQPIVLHNKNSQSLGENAVTLKNELSKWRKLGYTKIQFSSTPILEGIMTQIFILIKEEPTNKE